MNPISIKLKKVCCTFLALVLTLTFLSVSAFAEDGTDTEIAALVALQVKDDGFDFSTEPGIIDPGHFTVVGHQSDGLVNLWPTTANMTSDGKDDGKTVPYLVDDNNTTWYLSKIEWSNNLPGLAATETETILDSSNIYMAALNGSNEAYNFDPSVITGEPETTFAPALLPGENAAFYIVYTWTTTPPDLWATDFEKYTVKYELNLPEEVDALWQFKNGELDIANDGKGTIGTVQEQVDHLSQTVIAGMNFNALGELNGGYSGYMAFNYENPETYYYFDGWTVSGDTTGTVYDIGSTVPASDAFATEGTITLTGKWQAIPELTETDLKAAAAALPLDVFTAGTDKNGNNILSYDLMVQETDSDRNLDAYGAQSGNDVMLDEEGTISYRVSARVENTSASDVDAMTYGDRFAKFTFHLNIDSQLEFAKVNSDGTVSINFKSDLVKPVSTNLGDGYTISEPDENDNYIITFDPDSVPMDTGGMNIEINVEWIGGRKVSEADSTDPVQITGLDFKLKAPVTDKAAFKLHSSANITGEMDMRNKVPDHIRVYFREAHDFLQSDEWKEYFGGVEDPAVSFVHALQFMDYKLANIDLANDANAALKANTASATYTQYTITVEDGANGSVTPGTTQVYKGDGQTFTITPDSGYEIADVLVDGKSVGAVSSYTFENVTADHTIAASFRAVETGGETGGSSHTHNYVWQHSPDEHWQYCAECGSVVSNGPHTFQWKTDSNGNPYQECTVCGYRISAAQTGAAGTASATPAPTAASAPAASAAPASGVPQTSDDMPLEALIVVTAAAAAAFAALLVVRKRRHGND